MATNQNLQAKLREGVEAARRGDKIAARRLLQQVLIADKNNEIALMWMASVSDTLDDRRAYLRRVLQINPNNPRAREALARLGETAPAAGGATRGDAPTVHDFSSRRSGRSPNYYLIAAAFVAVAVIAVIAFAVLNSPTVRLTPTATNVANVIGTFDAQSTVLAQRNVTPTAGTALPTELPGIVVTFNPNEVALLPPTFTPTFTHTPLPTATLAPTAIPAEAYELLHSDYDPALGRGSLYIGDTATSRRIGQNEMAYDDSAYDSQSDRVIFVGPVYYEPEGDRPEIFAEEIFIAPMSNVENFTQLTRTRATRLQQPQWSPDGSRILFSADVDGDEDLFLMNTDGSAIAQLTNNDAVDTAARFRFDGLIVFASDVETPGFTEIYTIKADGSELTRLTNHPGNSYAPAWSPDGTRIAYINDQGGDGDLYVMDANGQRPFLLTIDDSGAEDRTPVWSPDGLWVAFSSNRQDDAFGWYATDLRGSSVWQILPSSARVPQTLTFMALKGEN